MESRSPRTVLFVLLLACLLISVPMSADCYELTVSAGKHDRVNTPVCVLLEEALQQANLNPVVLEKARSVTLTDPAGKPIPAQLTAPGLLGKAAGRQGVVARELHFVLPNLKKGQTLTLTATLSAAVPKAGGFSWKDTPGQFVQLNFGDRPVLQYVYKALDKSTLETAQATFRVFHHIFNPAGTRLVTKGAGGKYQHHRGLFFSYNQCSYEGAKSKWVNPWAGPGSSRGYGKAFENHKGILAEEAGPVLARHLVEIDWNEDDETVFVKEKREITVYNTPGGMLLEFANRVSSTVGKVQLGGNVHHSGIQFRADDEVAKTTNKLTYYLRPDGKGEPGKYINEIPNLPWNAMSFVVAGKRYTAVLLGTPANAKETMWGERDYGRFGTAFPYELDKGKDLSVNYRLWLQDGEMTIPQAAALETDFVQPVEVTVR